MEPSKVLELNAFIPAKDFALAKRFYQDLGFELLWGHEDIAQFRVASCTFLLQKFYVEQHAANFMMALLVEDAEAWWQHVQRIGLAAKYPGIRIQRPAMQPWGLRVMYLSDPSGVLWHIQDRKKA